MGVAPNSHVASGASRISLSHEPFNHPSTFNHPPTTRRVASSTPILQPSPTLTVYFGVFSGAIVVTSETECDIVVTKLNSPARIAKHLDMRQFHKPVVALAWLEEGLSSTRPPPIESHTINLLPYVVTSNADPSYVPPTSADSTVTTAKRSISPILVSTPSPPPPKRQRRDDGSGDPTGGPVIIISDSDDGEPAPNGVHPPPSPHPPFSDSSHHSDSPSHSDFSDSSSSDPEEESTTAPYDLDIPLDPTFRNTPYEVQRKHPLRHHNMELVELLGVIEKQREVMGEARSALSYRRAMAAITSYPRTIRSWREARKIKGVGDKIAKMIRQYLKTGHIRESTSIASSAFYQTLLTFASIYGVGPTKAREWYAKGYRTIADIRAGEEGRMSRVLQMGVEMFEDFGRKMTRGDVEEVVGVVEGCLREIAEGFVVTPVGGYRRGKELTGDCDVVITHPDENMTRPLLAQLVDILKKKGHVKHVMWYGQGNDRERDAVSEEKLVDKAARKASFDNLAKAFVAFRQPTTQTYRQLDLIISPPSLAACAILGWSGSKQFERGLREWCKKGIVSSFNSKRGREVNKGRRYHFVSHGLFDRATGKRVDVGSEREIFGVLGLEWVEPEERNA
ncbi:uncharacterized protein EV422DRAFT_547022 [Fimicolochytrium jonesii]|uniref:uncharacterized protein n=1 Tax=Fimicolochytrium jonesii TaxID=1396493 RepID=UPI0022FEFC01|nr:uncharacterized protein EV422DRAFT_547022 [Fimicolochytrium jonesii]KAI8816171.1 hypothetical protein EV422DRAFT_547022 [Fimicolochytrium jonesii]